MASVYRCNFEIEIRGLEVNRAKLIPPLLLMFRGVILPSVLALNLFLSSELILKYTGNLSNR